MLQSLRGKVVAGVVAGASLILLAACGRTPTDDCPKLAATAKHMDDVNKHLDEWGTICISTPLLIPTDMCSGQNRNPFAFELQDRKAKDYFTEAKNEVNGQVAVLTETIRRFGVKGEAKIDPVAAFNYATALDGYCSDLARAQRQRMLIDTAAKTEFDADMVAAGNDELAKAAAMRKYAAALGEPPTLPVFSPPPTGTTQSANVANSPVLDGTGFDGLVGGSQFSAAVSNTGNLSLPNRSALITAAGDVVTQGIFEVLGSPGEYQRYLGKHVLLGICSVSVNPGWRTSEGYAGDVSIKTGYTYEMARREVVSGFLEGDFPPSIKEMFKGNGKDSAAPDYFSVVDVRPDIEHDKKILQESGMVLAPEDADCPAICPVVSAISPMSEVQALDLANSQRKLTQTLLDLSLTASSAEQKASVQMVLDFLKRRQADLHTRTPITLANAYSLSGGVFGLQMVPRIEALGKPTTEDDRPGQKLDRQTFPILVLFGMDPEDAKPRILVSGKDGKKKNLAAIEAGDKLTLVEPQITLSQTTHWFPLRHSRAWYRWWERFTEPNTIKERDLAEWNLSLSTDDQTLEEILKGDDNDASRRLYSFLDLRMRVLRSKVFGQRLSLALPTSFVTPPVFTDDHLQVFPDQLPVEVDNDKLLKGTCSVLVLGKATRVLDPAGAEILTGTGLEVDTQLSKSETTDGLRLVMKSNKKPVSSIQLVSIPQRKPCKTTLPSRFIVPIVLKVSAPAPEKPTVSDTFPKFLDVETTSEGKISRAKEYEVLLCGNHLDKLDLQKIGRISDAEAFNLIADPPRSKSSSVVALTLKCKPGATAPDMLSFSLAEGSEAQAVTLVIRHQKPQQGTDREQGKTVELEIPKGGQVESLQVKWPTAEKVAAPAEKPITPAK